MEVEKKEKDKPENIGRDVVLDRQKRVITINGEKIDSFKPSFSKFRGWHAPKNHEYQHQRIIIKNLTFRMPRFFQRL